MIILDIVEGMLVTYYKNENSEPENLFIKSILKDGILNLYDATSESKIVKGVPYKTKRGASHNHYWEEI